MSDTRPDGDPEDPAGHGADHDAGHDADGGLPTQDRRHLVDLTRVEAGEPERRAPFRRFVQDDPET